MKRSAWRARRALVLVAALMPLWPAAAADVAGKAPGKAAGNLLVSWRVTGGADFRRQAQGLGPGHVVIDSRHGVSGRAGVEWSSQQGQVDQRIEQQVMVLNGGRARIDVRQQRPVTQWQWVAELDGRGRSLQSPQGALVSETVWLDSGQGLSVSPRWAGGRAPVVVELEAEAPVASAEPGHGGRLSRHDTSAEEPARLTAQTRVAVPLGQWVTVASTGRQQTRQGGRGWGTADIDQGDHSLLEIRVSLP